MNRHTMFCSLAVVLGAMWFSNTAEAQWGYYRVYSSYSYPSVPYYAYRPVVQPAVVAPVVVNQPVVYSQPVVVSRPVVVSQPVVSSPVIVGRRFFGRPVVVGVPAPVVAPAPVVTSSYYAPVIVP